MNPRNSADDAASDAAVGWTEARWLVSNGKAKIR
jgi:hypothetical protein